MRRTAYPLLRPLRPVTAGALTSALSAFLGVAAPVVAASQAGTAPPAAAPPSAVVLPNPANPDAQYRLGPDSLPQEGVPKGEVRGPFTLPPPP